MATSNAVRPPLRWPGMSRCAFLQPSQIPSTQFYVGTAHKVSTAFLLSVTLCMSITGLEDVRYAKL